MMISVMIKPSCYGRHQGGGDVREEVRGAGAAHLSPGAPAPPPGPRLRAGEEGGQQEARPAEEEPVGGGDAPSWWWS